MVSYYISVYHIYLVSIKDQSFGEDHHPALQRVLCRGGSSSGKVGKGQELCKSGKNKQQQQ